MVVVFAGTILMLEFMGTSLKDCQSSRLGSSHSAKKTWWLF